MPLRRHRLVLVAIAFALVPAAIELLNGIGAGMRLAGGSAGALRWFDSSQLPDTPWEALVRTRWPILMLVTGFAMLSPRGRWGVHIAWAYVIVVVITAFARFFLSGWWELMLPWKWNWLLPTIVCEGSYSLSFLLAQLVDLLPAVFLLIAAKALAGAGRSAAAVPVAAVAANSGSGIGTSPLLGYQAGRSAVSPSRWALRIAFAVACVAYARLVCELCLAGGNLLIGGRLWAQNTVPYYLFGESTAMSLDALSEYALRIGWALLLIGLWPTRRLVLSRNLVTAGVVAMTAWAALELLAVYISGGGGFTIAGHVAIGVIPAIRIEISEMAVMAMIVTLLHSPLPA